MKHQLWETKDKDRPYIICLQRTGEVILHLCKICGGAESSLPKYCPGRLLTEEEKDLISKGKLDFDDMNIGKEPCPVLLDGKIENFMIKNQGKSFHCENCGSNVFHKPDDQKLNLFKCNSCGQTFIGDRKD